MKKFMLVFLAAVMMFSLAACSSSKSSSGTGDSGGGASSTPASTGSDGGANKNLSGTVRVSLAGWQLEDGLDPQTGATTIGLNHFLKDTFYKDFPNIKLEITQVPWENAKAKQYSMLVSKDVDVLYTGGAYASDWYQEGLLRDIDDLVKNDPTFKPDIYADGLWNKSYSTKSPDGTHQYGIPAILGRRMTIYDKKLFEDWGVQPLSDHPSPQEILDAAMKMTGKNPKTGEQDYGLYWSGNSLNGSTIVALTLAFGAKGAEGNLSDMKNVKWELNTPEMAKMMEWIKEAAPLAPPGFVNGQGAENFGLAKNNIAIGLDQSGGATMSDYNTNHDQSLLDRFVPTMNMGPKGEGWVAVDPIIMAKDAKNVQASWEVMKYLASYDMQKHTYEQFANTPTLKNPDFIKPEDKYVQMALKIADVGHSELMDEANPFFMSDIVPAINGFASKAATGSAPDIQSFLDDLQKRAENWSKNLK